MKETEQINCCPPKIDIEPFYVCVIRVVKERHKATTHNGVPQGVFSYLSLMLLWLRDIIYIRPQGLFFLCEMVLLDVRYVF